MRVIKFRAWDSIGKKMLQPREFMLTWWTDGTVLPMIDNRNGKVNCVELLQFTGLLDKNGKEIFEGDIVRTDEAGWIAKVVFHHDGFLCIDGRGGFSTDCNWDAYEVIGNTYENPELLEVKE